MADFRDLITLPPWLRRPESVPAGQHQLSLFARAVGALFNGLLTQVYAVRRQWIAALATGAFLDAHGADRSVFRRAGELDAALRPRVLEGLRAKTPGETKAGMTIALNTLGLVNYQLLELYGLPVEDPADPRWDTFEIRYPDAGNAALTDAEIQARIDAAKPPRANGIAVRYRGATIAGFGARCGQSFGT